MNLNPSRFKWLAAGVLFVAPVLAGGCSAHATYGYRVYDNGYRDYHVYDRNEEVYYNRWVIETHHPHREFRRLHKRDRDDYWKWRHDHH